MNLTNNIYGPYTRAEWKTMCSLKEDLRFMKDSSGRGKVDQSIPLEFTKRTLRNYIRKNAA